MAVGYLHERSEYKLLAPPNGILIDGGIMPARDVANDGTWKILRGEDPSFLREACSRDLRYRDYRYGYDTLYSPSTAKVETTPFSSSITDIHGLAFSGRVWPNPPAWRTGGDVQGDMDNLGWLYVPDVIPREVGATEPDGADMVDACMSSSCQSVPANWAASIGDFIGGPLIADNVRKVFLDLSNTKTVLGRVLSDPDVATGGTYRQRYWNNSDKTLVSDDTNPTSGNYLGILTESRFPEGTVWPISQRDYTWVVSDIPPIDSRMSLLGLSPQCWPIFLVVVSGYGLANTCYDAYAVAGGIDANGTVTCAASSSEMRRLSVTRRGLCEYAPDLPYNSSVKADATLAGIVFYDGLLDFSELNWNWIPQNNGG